MLSGIFCIYCIVKTYHDALHDDDQPTFLYLLLNNQTPNYCPLLISFLNELRVVI